jgi:hypothetical protein
LFPRLDLYLLISICLISASLVQQVPPDGNAFEAYTSAGNLPAGKACHCLIILFSTKFTSRRTRANSELTGSQPGATAGYLCAFIAPDCDFIEPIQTGTGLVSCGPSVISSQKESE